MLRTSLTLLAASAIATALPQAVPATSTSSAPVFEIDGAKQYFAGTNTWWLSHILSDDDVDRALAEIAASDLKVTRVWGFGNTNNGVDQPVYFQYLDNTTMTITINEGANGIPRLDSVVRSAEKHGVQLVLPMLNNWDDLGGINTYCNYFGCNKTTFWTDPGAQEAYKNYVSFIVQRYKDSPAIFSWQLANEPRCPNCSTSVITKWAHDVSRLIKSLDPNTRVSLGDEGWLCGGEDYAYSCIEGIDFEANLNIPTLDYGTVHMYYDQWGYTSDWGNKWITDHAALAKKHGKPIVMEEYGVKSTVSNQTEILQQWHQTILDTDIAYDSFWQFATDLTDRDPYDDYAIYYGTELYNRVVIPHSKAMLAKLI
ncbi:hypothetical protein LTR64_008436 [Lithohypha guttulata]|uniref:uncharacterized protein n=1 Tax=Lithohypha guttulata TaxID=1690604 RepID=UPI002DE073A1|nr:hypothetical protein LTR51_008519 [Lithohypha guttulata]